MAFISSSDRSNQDRSKAKQDFDTMSTGLLMGIAMVGFGACLVMVLNGKAEEWLGKLRGNPRTQRAAAAAGEK